MRCRVAVLHAGKGREGQEVAVLARPPVRLRLPLAVHFLRPTGKEEGNDGWYRTGQDLYSVCMQGIGLVIDGKYKARCEH